MSAFIVAGGWGGSPLTAVVFLSGWVCYVALVLLRVLLPSPSSKLSDRQRSVVRLLAPALFVAAIGLFLLSLNLGLGFPAREGGTGVKILISLAYIAIALFKEQQLVHYVEAS